jgi:intergrase/recombinase
MTSTTAIPDTLDELYLILNNKGICLDKVYKNSKQTEYIYTILQSDDFDRLKLEEIRIRENENSLIARVEYLRKNRTNDWVEKGYFIFYNVGEIIKFIKDYENGDILEIEIKDPGFN